MMNEKPQIDRSVFLAERKKGVGGSDVASVFNVGYGCRRRLFYDKRNVPPDYPEPENDAIALGAYLEPFFGEKYAQMTGRLVDVRPEPLIHPEYPELRVNVDRMVDDSNRDQPGVLELKAVGRAVFYKIKREGLPEDYILQLQHGMVVAGTPWGSYGIGSRDSGELLHWDVDRDSVLADLIVAEDRAFWRQVQSGDIPDRLEPDDSRCQKCQYRKSCQGAALIQVEAGSNKGLERDETLRPLLTEYLERKKLLDEAEQLVEDAKEELKTRIGAREQLEVAGHKVYFRPQVAMRGDFAFLASEHDRLRNMLIDAIAKHPELWQAKHKFEQEFLPADTFKKAVESRPLRVY